MDYKGKYIPAEDYDPADWVGYWVYACEGGYKVWTYEPSPCEVEGMERA